MPDPNLVPVAKPDRFTRILGILTIVSPLIASIPSFLQLQKKEPHVVYSVESPSMDYPKSLDRAKITGTLRKSNLPDSQLIVSIANLGNAVPNQVTMRLTVPGQLIAAETDPVPGGPDTWVRVSEPATGRTWDGRSYVLEKMAIGPTFKATISYLRSSDVPSKIEIFADGFPSVRVEDIQKADQPGFSFRLPWRVFLVGLVVTLLYRLGREPRVRSIALSLLTTVAPYPFSPLLIRRTIQAREEWTVHRDDLLCELLKDRKVSLLSTTDGGLDSDEPDYFWDAIVQIDKKIIALDFHSANQSFDGLIGNEADCRHFTLRLLAMIFKGEIDLAFIILDEDVKPDKFLKIVDSIGRKKIIYLFGDTVSVAAAIKLQCRNS